jgi:hypothetical protein
MQQARRHDTAECFHLAGRQQAPGHRRVVIEQLDHPRVVGDQPRELLPVPGARFERQRLGEVEAELLGDGMVSRKRVVHRLFRSVR